MKFDYVHQVINESLEFNINSKATTKRLKELFQQAEQMVTLAIKNIIVIVLPKYLKSKTSKKVLKLINHFFETLKKSLDKEELPRTAVERFTVKILKLLLKGCNSAQTSVIMGAQVVLKKVLETKILEAVPKDLALKRTIRQLLKDKILEVRKKAISIAKSYSMEKDIRKSMASDPSKEVRKNAVCSLNLNTRNLCFLVDRFFDVDQDVRVEACRKFIGVKLTDIPKEKTTIILSQCSKDRSPDVRNQAFELVKVYLDHYSPHSPNIIQGVLDLCSHVEVQSCEQKYQKHIYKSLKLVIKNLVPIQELLSTLEKFLFPQIMSALEESQTQNREYDFPAVLVARVICEVLKEQENYELESILPSLESLESLMVFYNQTENWFLLHNTVLISQCHDIGEEAVREKLVEMLLELCKNISMSDSPSTEEDKITKEYFNIGKEEGFAQNSEETLALLAYQINSLLKQKPKEFPRVMSDLINELREPLDGYFEDTEQENLNRRKEALRREITSLVQRRQAEEDELERLKSIIGEVPNRLAQLNQTIEEKIQEYQELDKAHKNLKIQCLTLTVEMLRNMNQGELIPEIDEIIEKLPIQVIIGKESGLIYDLSVECLGLLSLQNQEICEAYIPIFKSVLQTKLESKLQFVNLKLVLDFFMVHKSMKSDPFSLLEDVMSYLESPNAEIKSLVGEGLGKLLLMERLENPRPVLIKLVLHSFCWDSPPALKQASRIFFNYYNTLSKSNSDELCSAFLTILGVIFYEEKKGGLQIIDHYSFDFAKFYQFIFVHLSPGFLKGSNRFTLDETQNYHFRISYFLCRELVKYKEKPTVKIICRMMHELDHQSFNVTQRFIIQELLKQLQNRTEINTFLVKFQNLPAETELPEDTQYQNSVEQEYQSNVELVHVFKNKLEQSKPPQDIPIKREPSDTESEPSKQIKSELTNYEQL